MILALQEFVDCLDVIDFVGKELGCATQSDRTRKPIGIRSTTLK